MTRTHPAGDGAACGANVLEELSRKYHAALLRYFHRRGIQHSDAQDLVQDVFVRLARQSSLNDVENIESYLFTVAGNCARDMFRRNKVRSDNPLLDLVEDLQGVEEVAPDRHVQGRQELDCILAALNQMPNRMRTIFILARLEDLPRSEIAERMGVSKRTVELEITKATACLADSRRRLS